MQTPITSYQSTPAEINCVALYKVAKLHGIKLQEPRIHVYLSGVLQRVNDPSEQPIFSKFVVSSIDELASVEEKHQFDKFPNIVPYRYARSSGDFFINWNALVSEGRDYNFPSACYSVAEFHSKKIGYNEQSSIFGILALNTDQYLNLLALFHQHLRENPDFEITDDDFEDVKSDLNITFKKTKTEIATPSAIKQKSSDKLLI
ncbi:MAG: hypothetical protein KKF89_02730 [Nanoarchaeota archaeon]|nr:hypothetical protein [Nanoarchaeota archaeon]MBU1854608.1 hypothetical protein [Nanoarchaeota archaeon]